VFLKAFANRLKRVIDSNTSDLQKAYSKSKVIHEALINILQFIKKGKLENKRLALLAIDLKKPLTPYRTSIFLKEPVKSFVGMFRKMKISLYYDN